MPDAAAAPPSRLFRVGVPILFAASVAVFVAALLLPAPGRSRPAADAVPVPPFRFTERNGASVGNADLLGKVWVASFVFTRCSGPCPQVTATMHRLQQDLDLDANDAVRLVTFTMDPEHDTPDVLKHYAADESRPAHSSRWLFLNGPEDEVHQLMKQGFRLAVERNAAPASAGEKYNHGTYLFLVDKAGRIVGHFDGYQGPTDADGERFRDSYRRLLEAVRGAT